MYLCVCLCVCLYKNIFNHKGEKGVFIRRNVTRQVATVTPSGCRVDAERMPSGCRVGAEWMPNGCWVDARPLSPASSPRIRTRALSDRPPRYTAARATTATRRLLLKLSLLKFKTYIKKKKKWLEQPRMTSLERLSYSLAVKLRYCKEPSRVSEFWVAEAVCKFIYAFNGMWWEMMG